MPAAGQQQRRDAGYVEGGREAESRIAPNATLSKSPRTLAVLWQEYEFGIDGRKPAKYFTFAERGKVKHGYTRRKLVWDTISALVGAGHTASNAIAMIYDVYGASSSVTKIIVMMRRDKTSGGHPRLRV